MTVADILEMMADGMMPADILVESRNLNTAQNEAALAYASDYVNNGTAA